MCLAAAAIVAARRAVASVVRAPFRDTAPHNLIQLSPAGFSSICNLQTTVSFLQTKTHGCEKYSFPRAWAYYRFGAIV